jgi:RNA polymerase sigma factor (sigma-70 family)
VRVLHRKISMSIRGSIESRGISHFRAREATFTCEGAGGRFRGSPKTRTKPTVSWDQTDDEFEGAPFSKYLKDPQPTPEERLQGLEHREMLAEALLKLPSESRRAIQLCISAEYSLKEAASALGLPVGTLKVRLHRGERALNVRCKRETQVWRKPEANKPILELCPASEESLYAA